MIILPALLTNAIILTTLAIGGILFILRARGASGSQSINAYAVGLILVGLLYLLFSQQTIIENINISFIQAAAYFLITLLPGIVFSFALEYKSHRRWLSFRILGFLAVFPLLTGFLRIFLNGPNALYAETPFTGTIFIAPPSIWGWLVGAYSIGILAGGFILFFIPFNVINVTPYKNPQMWYLAGSILIAILVNLFGFSNLMPIPNLGLILIGYVLIGIAFIFYKLSYHPRAINLISRDEILLGLEDGVIVLNGLDNIIDMNTTAIEMIGTSIRDAYGKPIDQIISNWSNLIHNKDARELEFRGSVYLNSQWRYLSVRLSPVKNSAGEDIGKILILRDITNRKSVNEDRQKARDEMFAFLRTLFNEAGNTQSIGDFLRGALFQIAYTFRVQNGAILMLEYTPDSDKPRFNLIAQNGPLTEKEDFLSRLHGSLGAVSWVMKNKQHLIITDAKMEPALDDLSSQYDHLSFGIFPLIADRQVIGLIVLARTEAPGLNSDEINRLDIAAEELASYIYADRQKQQNAVIAERQRLGRDLHDSVTQKLYGLVLLTEAIQVGLETGATGKTSEHVSRISVLSRQALREMRLFLHELQPVDFEHESFVSLLQQRLVAVEGHSDIQVQFHAAKNILIPRDKEVALYFISQEALNNIIKHAQAKSVQVKLTQKKQVLHLSIVDDGCGFVQGVSSPSGMGLSNMQSRADQIGATLKVTSSIGRGTKVSLLLPI